MSFFSNLNETRKWITLVLIALVLFFGYGYFTSNKNKSTIEYDTLLIQQEIKNVGKLVVTEGHFAEVITYKDKKETYVPGLTFDKKAIVIINADVTVAFDLSLIKYDVNPENKTVTILSIPKEEIKISPDFKYYDIESSSFNEFSAADYNKISKVAKVNLEKKIEKSSLKLNAKNRLISELAKMLIVTNSLGWTLKYNGESIVKETDLKL
uniref:DUF4230 domain-containing protein n=1 Tax=Flavobacterium sp. TaxID=239 RepID=UPI004049478E